MKKISEEGIGEINHLGDFDGEWYLRHYPDVRMLSMDPMEHYLWIGKRLNRKISESDYRKGGDGIHWGIVTTHHTLFIAHLLAENIRRHGWRVEIMTEMPVHFGMDYYIVLCAQMFERLPPGEKRIIYQLEQASSSRWMTKEYIHNMENSLAILEYSLDNINFFADHNVKYPQVYYLPIGASLTYDGFGEVEKEYDILFYGDYKSCERRRSLINVISRKYELCLLDTVFGDSMKLAIKKAKLVINIHYYENARLEMARIQECLSLGVPVVSETSSDKNDYPALEGAVSFFNEGSAKEMLSTIERALAVDDRAALIDESIKQSSERFAFMFDRFLMGADFLSAAHLEKMDPPPSVRRGCSISLSLPETISRRRMFQTVQPENCEIFDGLRRRPGWIGCGMSYKFLAQSALRVGLPRITIMEDDVILPPNFDEKIAIIQEYLHRNEGRWDVFCGVIASLHPEAKILQVENFGGLEFVTIDKMTSMIFNIYAPEALELLAAWDPLDTDVDKNTIDRYLEHAGLRIVTVCPYLVGHHEELHSTLWGFQNTQYVDMISESEHKLLHMKNRWIAERNDLINALS